jgi:cytochrome c
MLAACATAPLTILADPVDLALATAKNCISCHNIDRKVVGPAYRDVAAKYRGDKAAQARLAAKIRSGGGGVWGVVKMPSNPQVSEAEAKQLAGWVLRQ